MDIAVIGAGNVGGTLGARWAALGHRVVFGVRNPDDPKHRALLAQAGEGARLARPADAAAGAAVVLLATPWAATEEALRGCGNLASKVLVDATNPLDASLSLTLGHTDSGGEQVARWAPGARVVKAFNTTGFNVMADPVLDGRRALMLVAGDDAAAKGAVLELASALGFEAVDAGALAVARLLEPMAQLWIHCAYRQGLGRDYAFALLRHAPR